MKATGLQVHAINVLRRYLWLRSPERTKALNRTKYYAMVNSRRRVFWVCELCGVSGLTEHDREVDHIVPVVDPNLGFQGLDVWLERCIVTADKLQVICKECHQVKSTSEGQTRAKTRRASKKPKIKKKRIKKDKK